MFRRRTDFGGEAELLADSRSNRFVTDIAPGDSIAVVRELTEDRGWDLSLMRQGADGTEFEGLLTADWNEANADVSPDGRWIAYQSDESGEYRIYVRSFPEISRPYNLSSGSGISPLWSPDGGTLYYTDGSRFMAVDVATEPAFSASEPRLLFEGPNYLTLDSDGSDSNWGIHPDGSRFVVVKSSDDDESAAGSTVYLVTNWFEELRQRMGN
jgi:serine/threonine-protein kinase